MREILAAWICCCLVGLGAITVVGHRDPGTAVDAGVHIPDRVGSVHPHLSIEDEFADDASDLPTSTASSSEEPSIYSQQDVVESGKCRLRSFGHRLL
jgi:hypothetical protein